MQDYASFRNHCCMFQLYRRNRRSDGDVSASWAQFWAQSGNAKIAAEV
jgi:hypothetical protein